MNHDAEEFTDGIILIFAMRLLLLPSLSSPPSKCSARRGHLNILVPPRTSSRNSTLSPLDQRSARLNQR
jgi:hypothetical protein